MRRLTFLAGVACLLGCPTQPMGDPDAGVTSDAGVDAGADDSGVPDAGVFDAGMPDAGGPDAGLPDAGTPDAGPGDAGGPRLLGPAKVVSIDASILLDDAGYAEVDLTGRTPLTTTYALTLDGGFVVAISPQSLVVAEGPQCELSFVNRSSCDYLWLSSGGNVLASVGNAYGLPNVRGEVMMLDRDFKFDCPDPVFANQALYSAIPALMDLDTGAMRLSWPRSETGALADVGEKGDLVADPRGQRSCDAGAPFISSPIAAFNRVRAPYQKFTGTSASELGAERLLLIDAGFTVTRIEADGSARPVAPQGPASIATVHLDTFTLQRGLGYYRASIEDGGALLPLATLTGMQYLTPEGGRFAAVIEPPDYKSRYVIDSEALLPDLRYPITGQLLERAPLLFGIDVANKLVVARLDLGTAASSPFTVPYSLWTVAHFPEDDAAIVIDNQNVAWVIDVSGVKRLSEDAVNLPFRSFNAPPGAPDVLLLVRRHTSGGPLELVAVDRRTRRLVTLSHDAFVNLSPDYLGGCDVPGLMTPGSGFIYFAEPSAQPGQIDLYMVRSDFSENPRRVGTTLANACTLPVVSRDGTRVAVQETLGGPATVSTATW